MAPEERFVPRFAAEPPQEDLPYGRWQERLREELLGAVAELETDGAELGEPGEPLWYPDRSWHGHTYVPATAPTSGGYELFGYVRFLAAAEILAKATRRWGHTHAFRASSLAQASLETGTGAAA